VSIIYYYITTLTHIPVGHSLLILLSKPVYAQTPIPLISVCISLDISPFFNDICISLQIVKCKFRSYIIQGYVNTYASKTKCYVNINAYCMTCQFETVSKSYVIGQVSEFKLEYKKLQFYVLRDKLCLYIFFLC